MVVAKNTEELGLVTKMVQDRKKAWKQAGINAGFFARRIHSCFSKGSFLGVKEVSCLEVLRKLLVALHSRLAQGARFSCLSVA